MVTGTKKTKKQQSKVQPMDDQMWERHGFDRRGIRRELAGVNRLELGDKYVEQEERSIIDPRTIDMPVGPTGMGEVGGSGVEELRIDGERFPTHRWTQGFSVLEEDNDDLSLQRNAIMELFDFFSDASFLTGLGPNGQYAEGAIDWLRNAIPAERQFDCSTFAADTSYDDREENVIFFDAQSVIRNELIDADSGQWDTMLGSHNALTNFNKVSGAEGGRSGDTYWERLSHPDATGGVSSQNRLPYEIAPTKLPTDLEDDIAVDQMIIDIVDESVGVKDTGGDSDGVIGTDEVFLLPSLSAVRSDMLNTWEMGTPHYFGPHPLRGGKEAHDYVTRYTHDFNPKEQHSTATDVIHLTNVSELFD